MTTNYTVNIRLAKPDFRSPSWADAMNANFDAIDAALRNVLMNVVPWSNVLNVSVGQVVSDTVVSPINYWICNVTHTTVAGPGTFATERAANPTYWTAFSFGIKSRGAWTNNTAYVVNDIAYDSVRGITGVCTTPHTSNLSGSIQDDAASWSFIVNLPTVFTAVATNYDNSTSHLATTNVQGALDLIFASVAGAYISSNTTYDHTISGLASTNVKAALDELRATQIADEVNIATNTTNLATGTIATGFMQWRPTSETLTGWIIANGLTIGNAGSGATSRANLDTFNLYAWHWNNFSNTECPVTTGRGANALADFNALKAIVVLDMKGTMGGLGIDTMGGSASTRLSSVPVVTGNTTTPGSILGENTHALAASEMANHTHNGVSGTMNSNTVHSHSYTQTTFVANQISQGGGGSPGSLAAITSTSGSTNTDHTHSFSTDTGTVGNTAHNVISRSRAGNWHIKL